MGSSQASLVIAIAALAVSLSAFLTSRWRDRRDLLLRVHERLVTVEQQQARRLIHRLGEQGKRVEDYTDDEYAVVNNALAAFNVLGIYYKRRYIRRRDVLELWAVPLLRLMSPSAPFLAHRDSFTEGHLTWPELRDLAADAEIFLRRRGREGEVLRKLPPQVTADSP